MATESVNRSGAAAGLEPNAMGGAPRRQSSLSGAPGVALFLIIFGSAVFLTYRTLTTADIPTATPLSTDFYCLETKKHFEYGMKEGEHWPVISPYTQRATGYPAEKCYWTKDGRQKKEPTFVILNVYLGKPGDTFCPDCGRLVVGHNPAPKPDVPFADGQMIPMTPTSQP